MPQASGFMFHLKPIVLQKVCGINEVNKSYSHRSHVTSLAHQKCASVHDGLQGKGHFTLVVRRKFASSTNKDLFSPAWSVPSKERLVYKVYNRNYHITVHGSRSPARDCCFVSSESIIYLHLNA